MHLTYRDVYTLPNITLHNLERCSNIIWNMEKEQNKGELDELEVGQSAKLILLNDEVNTFDHVIDCLISICKHSPTQAEQCAIITHFKGRCTVKTGSYEELIPFKTALQDNYLTVIIE